MTDATQNELLSPRRGAVRAPAAARGQRQARYFFGPVADFLLLGGGSAIALGLIAIFAPKGIGQPQQAFLVTVLMILVNQPHFAHSYQLFYRNFALKAFGDAYSRELRLRYLFAGIAAPVLLVLFLAFAVWRASVGGNARLLSYGANWMFFLVGWHYAKQGYGILIVDSVQKGLMFSARAKAVLRINAYACWMVSWIWVNHALPKAMSYLGIIYYTLPIPLPVYYAALAIGTVTSLLMLLVFAQRWREGRALPWNGIVAYVASLYLWIIVVRFNPILLLLVPTFHSLQYLAVVWRYQLNAAASAERPAGRYRLAAFDRVWPDGALRRIAVFFLTGIALGVLGFAAVPNSLDAAFSYQETVFGPTLFLFLFYIFINVHHYFLDNVMWRRGNPDIQKHLLGRF